MKWVIMGDLHYPIMARGTARLKQLRDAFFPEIFRQFFAMDADFHISLGDITNEGLHEEWERVMGMVQALSGGRTFIHVIGNHDTYALAKSEILTYTKQQRYRAIDLEEALLLFLDTTKELSPNDWGGFIDPEQLAWLEQQIEQSGSKPLLIFAHHPVRDTTVNSSQAMLYIEPDDKLWSVLSKKRGAGFFINGHNHHNSIARRNQWVFVQTAAVIDVPGFRTVQLNKGSVEIGFTWIRDPHVLEQAEEIGRNMIYYQPQAKARGSESDWQLRIDCADLFKGPVA